MKTNDNIENTGEMKGSEKQNGNTVDLAKLTFSVKNEDAKNLRITRSFLWLYIIMILVYSWLMVFDPDKDITIIQRVSGLFYVASMVAFALIFRKGYKEYKNIDYTLPIIDMLKNAANRYRLKTRKFVELSIPILLMDVGLTLSFYHRMMPESPIFRVLLIQAFYIPTMTLAGFIGYLKWHRKQKPLSDNALKLIEELEGE